MPRWGCDWPRLSYGYLMRASLLAHAHAHHARVFVQLEVGSVWKAVHFLAEVRSAFALKITGCVTKGLSQRGTILHCKLKQQNFRSKSFLRSSSGPSYPYPRTHTTLMVVPSSRPLGPEEATSIKKQVTSTISCGFVRSISGNGLSSSARFLRLIVSSFLLHLFFPLPCRLNDGETPICRAPP